MKVGRNP